MHKLEGHTEKIWFIFSNSDETIYRYSSSCSGCVTESGMYAKETFTVKQDWLDRLTELGLEHPEE